MDFALNPTSYVFRAGSRLRFTVTGAETGTYQLPDGVQPSDPPALTIFHGGSHASRIELPVIPPLTHGFEGRIRVASDAGGYSGAATAWLSPAVVYLRYDDGWHCVLRRPARAVPSAAKACQRPRDTWRIDESAGPDGKPKVSISGAGISFDGTGIERMRTPIELLAFFYFLAYIPYAVLTRWFATIPYPPLGRALTGLEVLPAATIMSGVFTYLFVWLAGWAREAHHVRLGGGGWPWPTRWTTLSGIGTALLLFTVPLSFTFKGVSIPFMQLLMRGDVLIIAPAVDLMSGRRVRWYSWVALVLVAAGLAFTIRARGGLYLPPLAVLTVVLYTVGYSVRLWVMTRVATSRRHGGGSLRQGEIYQKPHEVANRVQDHGEHRERQQIPTDGCLDGECHTSRRRHKRRPGTPAYAPPPWEIHRRGDDQRVAAHDPVHEGNAHALEGERQRRGQQQQDGARARGVVQRVGQGPPPPPRRT